jgi:phosphomannomutase
VGRDNRPSGESLAAGIRSGIAQTGATAIDVGMLPTPALYFAVHALKTDGGLQVTGSHNPPEFNGFKMVLAGESLHGDGIGALYDIIAGETWRMGRGSERHDTSVLSSYREAIVERNQLERPVHVVVDCGNGVGSLIAVSTLRTLGAEVTPLFCESDGTFPGPAPSWESHSMATPTALARWMTRARLSTGISSSCSMAATRFAGSGWAYRSSSM